MTSRERVLTALRAKQPDRVPYVEITVDRALSQRLMAWEEPSTQAASLEVNAYTVEEIKSVARRLKMDNIYYILRAPVWADRVAGQDGRLFYGEGLVKTEKDLPLMIFPDPTNEALYAGIREFIQRKDDFAAFFITRVGIFPTWLSMGLENFSVALYENRHFVETVLNRYVDWAVAVADRVCKMGFDVYVSTDDMAFKTAPFFSPKIFREMVLPCYRRVREKVTLPWIIHSDGNILPFVDDLLDLGISGIHPNEKGALDIRMMKKRYGSRVCLLGNVDLNILGLGIPKEVEDEVRELIRDVGLGGGYMLSSGNSLAGYLRPENVLAMSEAVQKYGGYPLMA
ncbi:MAG: uroporphyrinogen decarboxylase family protein [Terriglobia bacterium]